MTSNTLSDPLPGGNILLPVRFKPALGEAVASYMRRLAVANGITRRQLAKLCGHNPAVSAQARHILAGRVGIESQEFDALTLASARTSLREKPSSWRLKSTVWTCHSCSLEGIEDALRGFAIQFLCLRCKAFLRRPEGINGPVAAPNDELVALQMELLDAIPVRDHEALASRFARMWHLISTGSLTRWYREAINVGLSGAESCRSDLSRARSFAYGIPEVPRVVGAVLSMTWEQTASPNVLYLQTRALRKINHWEFPRSAAYKEFTDVDPADYMQCSFSPTAGLDAIGEQIRHLVRRCGLRSSHVPEEVRYRSDPILIDATVWRWRRHVCRQLRLWLLQIELSDEVIACRRDGRPIPLAVDRRLDQLSKSFYTREATVGDFTAETARTVLSQILSLAHDIVHQVRSYADPRVRLDRELLQQLAPSATVFGPGAVDIARAWMWLDEVAGQDAYGYLPTIAPFLMERFDQSLRPDERLSLREYRIRQQTVLPQDITPYERAVSPAGLLA